MSTVSIEPALERSEGVLVRTSEIQPRKRAPAQETSVLSDELPWAKGAGGCKEKGIKHKLISIATPKQNGKVERSHRTDDKEFHNQRGLPYFSKVLPMFENITGRKHSSPFEQAENSF